jgi:type II secretory pathway component PulK
LRYDSRSNHPWFPQAIGNKATRYQSIKFHGFVIDLQVLSENAKVDLNAAPEALLQKPIANTIDGLQSDGVSAAQITDAILDWRDADSNRRPDGAESTDYVSAGRRPE